VSDPIKTRLDRRREELGRRVEFLDAEATGAGEWSEGASLALHAACDEARHLLELYEVMYLVAMRQRWNLSKSRVTVPADAALFKARVRRRTPCPSWASGDLQTTGQASGDSGEAGRRSNRESLFLRTDIPRLAAK